MGTLAEGDRSVAYANSDAFNVDVSSKISNMDDVFPKRDAEFAAWYAVFAQKAAAISAVLPNILTASVLTQIGVNAILVRDTVNGMVAIGNFAAAMAEFKVRLFSGDSNLPLPAPPSPPAPLAVPPGAIAGIKPWTRALIRRIKADPAYTESIGEGLGIIAVRPARQDPSLQVRRVFDSTVELRVRRGGYTAVVIESRRNDGPWETIGFATIQRFVDGRPPLVPGQAERREYRAQGIHRNQRTGGLSEVVATWTTPVGP